MQHIHEKNRIILWSSTVFISPSQWFLGYPPTVPMKQAQFTRLFWIWNWCLPFIHFIRRKGIWNETTLISSLAHTLSSFGNFGLFLKIHLYLKSSWQTNQWHAIHVDRIQNFSKFSDPTGRKSLLLRPTHATQWSLYSSNKTHYFPV